MPVTAVVATTAISAVLLIGPGQRVTNWYLQNATLALINKEYGNARLCYAGLLQREPDNPKYQFGLALSLFGLGDNSAALILTRRLAPEGEGGYGPAHVFVAERLVTDAKSTDEELRSAERHLLNALATDPNDRRANALIAALYARTANWQGFKAHVARAGDAVDEIGLLVAQQLLADGDAVEAEGWVRRAVQFHRNRAGANEKDYASRLAWAQGLLMLREFEPAVDLLEKGLADSGDGAFAQAAAQAYLQWSSAAALTPARRMAVLHRGLTLAPGNQAMLMQLASPLVIESAANARPATQPSEGAVVQLICNAVNASCAGDSGKVVAELSSAILLGDAHTPEMVANLACLWGYSDQPNAASALPLAEGLAQILPDSPLGPACRRAGAGPTRPLESRLVASRCGAPARCPATW